MMRKIELSFNYIWTVKHARSWASRVSEYLFAVIVSPILLFISISITSFVSTNYFQNFLEGLTYGGLIIQPVAFIAPILLMSFAFAFVYSFLPNTKVQFGSAFIGGFVTTIIWKLMGTVFQGLFATSAREQLYLAFATAIIVLVFTYVGWLVALVGSSIAFYHQYPAKARNGREKTALSLLQQEEVSLAVAAMIIRRFQNGEEPLNEYEISLCLDSNSSLLEPALNNLEAINLITPTSDDPPRFVPTRAVSDCSIVDIWLALRRVNSESHSYSNDSEDMQRIKRFQSELDSTVKSTLSNEKFY